MLSVMWENVLATILSKIAWILLVLIITAGLGAVRFLKGRLINPVNYLVLVALETCLFALGVFHLELELSFVIPMLGIVACLTFWFFYHWNGLTKKFFPSSNMVLNREFRQLIPELEYLVDAAAKIAEEALVYEDVGMGPFVLSEQGAADSARADQMIERLKRMDILPVDFKEKHRGPHGFWIAHQQLFSRTLSYCKHGTYKGYVEILKKEREEVPF